MRGKLADVVYTRNRGGNISREYVIPTNTITPRKTGVQNLLTTVSQLWSSIPQSNRDEWNKMCMFYRETSNIGTNYYKSGFNLFVEETFNIFLCAQVPTTLPILHEDFDCVYSASVTIPNLTSMILHCDFTDGTSVVPANTALFIRGSVGVSQGINYKRSNIIYFRGWAAGVNVNAREIYPDYLIELGTLTSGTKIFFEVFSINITTGQRSAVYRFYTIVP